VAQGPDLARVAVEVAGVRAEGEAVQAHPLGPAAQVARPEICGTPEANQAAAVELAVVQVRLALEALAGPAAAELEVVAGPAAAELAEAQAQVVLVRVEVEEREADLAAVVLARAAAEPEPALGEAEGQAPVAG